MDRHCLMRSRVRRSAPRAMRGRSRIYSKTMHAFAQKFSQDGWNIRSPFTTQGIVTCPRRCRQGPTWRRRDIAVGPNPRNPAISAARRAFCHLLFVSVICCDNRLSVVESFTKAINVIKVEPGRLLARGGKGSRVKTGLIRLKGRRSCIPCENQGIYCRQPGLLLLP
jgi:hypothetical protein